MLNQIELRGIDFKDTLFTGCEGCAIEKAVARTLNISYNSGSIGEGILYIIIRGDILYHNKYEASDFRSDKKLAEDLNYSPDVVIRILELSTSPVVTAPIVKEETTTKEPEIAYIL